MHVDFNGLAFVAVFGDFGAVSAAFVEAWRARDVDFDLRADLGGRTIDLLQIRQAGPFIGGLGRAGGGVSSTGWAAIAALPKAKASATATGRNGFMVILQYGAPILANPALPTGAIALFCAAFARRARNLAAAVAAVVVGAARSFGDRGFRGNVIS